MYNQLARDHTGSPPYLSAALLAGLLLNATLGWGWADPIAGLVIAAVAVKEGLGAWRGDACCTAPSAETLVEDEECCTDDGCHREV